MGACYDWDMASERDKIIAYLRGMAHMSLRQAGMRGTIVAQALDSAATQIANMAHDEADALFPEHMPPRYTITRADRPAN